MYVSVQISETKITTGLVDWFRIPTLLYHALHDVHHAIRTFLITITRQQFQLHTLGMQLETHD